MTSNLFRKRPSLDSLVKALVIEAFMTLERESKETGQNIMQQGCASLIASIIGASLLAALREKPDFIKTEAEHYKYSKKILLEYKMGFQDAVAAGFEGAMKAYSGKLIEYNCQIKPVAQESGNKLPC